jgi:hypothetical protein
MRRAAFVCLLLSVTLQLRAQAKKPCSREQAIAAESEASSLQSWSEVYGSFKRFSSM